VTVHHVEVFCDSRGYGVQCFTCRGDVAVGLPSLIAAEATRDDHEGACSCRDH
jgi:hypothetical protein